MLDTIESLRNEVDLLKTESEEKENRIRKLEEEFESKEKRIRKLEEDSEAKENRVFAFEQLVKTLQEDLTKVKQELSLNRQAETAGSNE